jgi:hypothetical protein
VGESFVGGIRSPRITASCNYCMMQSILLGCHRFAHPYVVGH